MEIGEDCVMRKETKGTCTTEKKGKEQIKSDLMNKRYGDSKVVVTKIAQDAGKFISTHPHLAVT